MKARGGRFVIILGGALAALAFVVVYLLMSKSNPAPEPAAQVPVEPQLATVAVVSRDLPAYTLLDSTNVATTEVEASTVQSNTTSSPSALYGKMTLVPYVQGQQVQLAQLTQSGFSNVLQKGEKAFTLAVNEQNTFAAGLTENDRIDVLWTASFKVNVPVKQPDNKFTYEKDVYTSTKTLLQDIKVLRVVNLRAPAVPQSKDGQSAEAAAAKTGATTVSGAAMYTGDAPYASAIILAVTDQQAEVLKFARENGWIDLTLRSSAMTQGPDNQSVRGDHEVEKTTGITIDTLITQYGLMPPPVEWQVGTGGQKP